jgi:hypothetical protein
MLKLRKSRRKDPTLTRATSEADRSSYMTKRTLNFRVRRSRRSMTRLLKIRRIGLTNRELTSR